MFQLDIGQNVSNSFYILNILLGWAF